MNSSRLLIAGAIAAMLPLAGAIAQSPTPEPAAEPSQPAPQRQGATFESLDTDSDGRISKTEAAANQAVTEQFSRYDKNSNGFIEREEVTSSNSSPPADPAQK
jgi:Ca2+-binding EF-hand superfamily protein